MPVRVTDIAFSMLRTRTRMPFRYGIAELTEVPHLVMRLELEVDGARTHGLAAEGLPPKWFTKNPAESFEHELAQMWRVIRSAADIATESRVAKTVFDLWWAIHERQRVWAEAQRLPPLLWGLGVSLVERAMIDAFCRAAGLNFAAAVRRGALGIELQRLCPELTGYVPAHLLPEHPNASVLIRHTVGLGDPITDADIPGGERLDDGLPQSLEASIRAYGLKRFKIKLSGDLDADLDRLRALATLFASMGPDHAFTVDANEQFPTAEAFRETWMKLRACPDLVDMLAHLRFVEQPLPRDKALSSRDAGGLLAWDERPPLIIDESGGTLDALPRALALGYAGASHKNCKGVFKGIANAALLEHRRRNDPEGTHVLSGEDLANLGPIALLQDLTVCATLGIDHVERNGHHYFRGLSMFPQDVQAAVLGRHGDLYRRHEDGFPTLDIRDGAIRLGSVIAAPFGADIPWETDTLPPLPNGAFDVPDTEIS